MHLKIGRKFNFFFYSAILIILTSINNYNLRDNNIVRIEVLEISGFSEKKNEIIKDDIKDLLKKNIFFLEKDYFLKLINRNDTKKLNIKKIYPNKLMIDFIPAKPLCIILINNNKIILGDNKKKLNIDITENNLPIILGSSNIDEIFEVLNLLKTSKMEYSKIYSVEFFKSGRFDINLKNGVLLKFPFKYSLDIINYASNLLKNKNFINSKIIDLRVENKIIKYE